MSNHIRHHDQSKCADYDFRHTLYNTIILLGGKKEIAGLLKKSLDNRVSDADVDSLRSYNLELMDDTKDRLSQLNTLTIRTA